jgi:hypothetical protein
MAVISTLEGSGFIPEIFLAIALGYLRNYITVLPSVTMDTQLVSGETFSVGATLHLPKRGTLNVNQKAETGSYVVQNPQSSLIDLTLNHHPEVSFALTSEVLAFQNQPQQQGYAVDAIAKLAEDVDINLLSLWKTVPAAQTITNAGTMTEANILSARKILRDNKVPAVFPAFGAVSTAEEAAILQLPNLVRWDAIGRAGNVARAEIGEGPTLPGSIGSAYGFQIAPTQLVPQVAGNDNTLQTLTITGAPTGGTFVPTTGAPGVAYNAAPAQVQASLTTVFGKGNVYVSGTAGSSYQVAIIQGAATLVPSGAFTGGTSPAIAAAQVAQTVGGKNLFYTQDAILFASRALPLPPAGTGALGTVMTDPLTGLTMRMVTSWNPSIGSMQISLDMLYGFCPMRPEHLVLIQTSS